MSASAFDEFINRKTAQSDAASSIHWERRREDWLADIEGLYRDVARHLRDYLDDGRIVMSRESVTLDEEGLSRYSVPKLVLQIGSDTVDFIPIGTLIFGAWGRVDLVGPQGRVRLVLVERDTSRASLNVSIITPESGTAGALPTPRRELCWKIAGPPPDVTFAELNSETLRAAILEVANA